MKKFHSHCELKCELLADSRIKKELGRGEKLKVKVFNKIRK